MSTPSRDLARTVLAIISLTALIAASFQILRPFLLPITWASTIVVATWPVLLKVEALFRGRRRLAVTAMTLVLLLVFVIPFAIAVAALVENSDRIAGWVKSLATWQLPPPPDFVSRIPIAGARIARMWGDATAGGPGYLTAHLEPYADDAARWLVTQAGSVGRMTLEFLLTVVIAAILYANGEAAADGLRQFARRLMGAGGDRVVRLAGQAIRGVALGVVVTAIVQSVLAGIGLAVAGIPLVPILTALCFVLVLAQVGPFLVLVPAVIWLYWKGEAGWATALLVWTILVGTADNVLRSMLIKRGADLPLLLIFAGVIGGLMAFGIVGIFVGPVALAVTYTLLEEWVTTEPAN